MGLVSCVAHLLQRLAGTFYERDHLRRPNISIDGNVETGMLKQSTPINMVKNITILYLWTQYKFELPSEKSALPLLRDTLLRS